MKIESHTLVDGLDDDAILKTICENSYNSILITDANLELPGPKIVYANQAFTKKTGYSMEELKGKTPRILQGEETDKDLLAQLKEKCVKGEFFSGNTINYTKDGKKYHVEWNISPIKNSQGKITHYLSIQKNITKELEMIHSLQRIIDLQESIIIITDGEKLNFVNHSFLNFFNVDTLEEFLMQNSCICSRFRDVDGFYYKKEYTRSWIEDILKLSSEQRLVTLLDKMFQEHGFFVNLNNFEDNKYIISFTDITKTLGEKERFKHKAYHDNLTDAFNREFLENRFEVYRKEAEKENLKLGLILFDIDHFKLVNDTYGHNVGDEVLKKIVKIAKDTIRLDDFIVRWGGEEFIVLTKVRVLGHLTIIAEHIRTAIENDTFLPVPSVRASFGITLGKKEDSLESFVKRADDALYEAKETGRNKVVDH